MLLWLTRGEILRDGDFAEEAAELGDAVDGELFHCGGHAEEAISM